MTNKVLLLEQELYKYFRLAAAAAAAAAAALLSHQDKTKQSTPRLEESVLRKVLVYQFCCADHR